MPGLPGKNKDEIAFFACDRPPKETGKLFRNDSRIIQDIDILLLGGKL